MKNTAPKIDTTKWAEFKIVKHVRIRKLTMVFAKGYTSNWANEIFIVHQVQSIVYQAQFIVPITYLLQYHTGEVFKASVYKHEISKFRVGVVYLKNSSTESQSACALVRICR